MSNLRFKIFVSCHVSCILLSWYRANLLAKFINSVFSHALNNPDIFLSHPARFVPQKFTNDFFLRSHQGLLRTKRTAQIAELQWSNTCLLHSFFEVVPNPSMPSQRLIIPRIGLSKALSCEYFTKVFHDLGVLERRNSASRRADWGKFRRNGALRKNFFITALPVWLAEPQKLSPAVWV
jgi:hypothetical protein